MIEWKWTVKFSPELAQLLYPPDNHLSLTQRLTAIFSVTGSQAFEDVAWTVLGLYRANEMGADAARKCLDRAWKRACPGMTRPGYPKGFFSENHRRPSDKFVAPNPVGPLPAGLVMKNQIMGSYGGPYVTFEGSAHSMPEWAAWTEHRKLPAICSIGVLPCNKIYRNVGDLLPCLF